MWGSYKLEVGLFDTSSHTSNTRTKSWWKFLWSLSVPPKVRIFWWRALPNIIPSRANLLRHHVPVTDLCQLCGYDHDSTEHALFWCLFAKKCWKDTIFHPFLKQVKDMDFLDTFIRMEAVLRKEDMEVFAMRTWAVWHDRLRLLHEKVPGCAHLDVEWSASLLKDFKEAREPLLTEPTPKPLPQLERWTRPPVNTLKLEVDAAVNYDTGGYSIGGIMRDHDCQILLAFGKRISKPQSVVFAELLSIRDGMRLLQERGIEAHVINTDSLLAVQTVINPAEDFSYCGALALDIRNSLDNSTDTVLRQVGRSVNRVAHSLAFFSLSSSDPIVWENGVFPFWLVNLVTNDLLHSK